MKHAVYGVVLGLILILFVAIGVTVQGRAVRADEAEETLAEAIEATANLLFSGNKVYTIDNNEEFVADFLKELSLQLGSDSKLSVDVVKADYDRGMLSIKITENYSHPNGKEGTVEAYKTVIYDQKTLEDTKMATVSFYRTKEDMENGGEVFKTSRIVPGDTVFPPEGPKHPDNPSRMKFIRWMGADGNAFDAGGMEFEATEETNSYMFFAEYAQSAEDADSTENAE